jgi:UDP-N-acetylglucosamine:LPS N-acetylglucosamine transferase
MAKVAEVVTVTFEKSLADYGPKAKWVGSIMADSGSVGDEDVIREKYGLENVGKIILVLGGGTGSEFINNLVWDNLDELLSYGTVFHITGKGKMIEEKKGVLEKKTGYHHFDFMNNSDLLYFISSSMLVISRCGLATLSELCFFKKAVILIPMPNSHQEDNAGVFEDVAVVMGQENFSNENFLLNVKELAENDGKRKEMEEKMKEVIVNGNEAMRRVVGEVVR